MSVSTLYWRQLDFDNSKHMSFLFQNYSPVINSEVLIHIAKADAPEPNNDSPYMTIPSLSFRSDVRTEPGDKVYYTTRNGGEISFHCTEINQTHNYNIPTSHTEITVSGEYRITVPEGAMVSLQANPERNTPEAFLIYHIGPEDTNRGRFRLYGAQQVSYTFTTETEIVLYGEDFYVDVLITASQNVSQLSKEMQDKLDKLVADLEAAMKIMATKDELKRVNMKTYKDNFILLPSIPISSNVIKTGYFYNKFKDTELDIVDNDIITVAFNISFTSTNQDVIKDCNGTIFITIKYKEAGSEVISFSSTDPELTKLSESGIFVINNSVATEDMETKWQRCEMQLNVKPEIGSLLTGTVTPLVKCNSVPLRKETTIVFNDDLNVTQSIKYLNLYQNVEFMEEIDINSILGSLTINKDEYTSILRVTEFVKDVNEFMLNRYTIKFNDTHSLIFSMNSENLYDLKLLLAKGEYPSVPGKTFKPSFIEVFKDSMLGDSYMINLALINKGNNVTDRTENMEYTTTLLPLNKRKYDYIDDIITFLTTNASEQDMKVRVIYNEK